MDPSSMVGMSAYDETQVSGSYFFWKITYKRAHIRNFRRAARGKKKSAIKMLYTKILDFHIFPIADGSRAQNQLQPAVSLLGGGRESPCARERGSP